MTWHLEDARKHRGKNRAGLSFKERNPLLLREPALPKCTGQTRGCMDSVSLHIRV